MSKDKGQSAKKCIFCKIISKESPATILYEDNKVIAFYDKYPVKKVHFLVVPKKCIRMFQDIEEKDKALMGTLLLTAKKVAEQLNLINGYRLVINNGSNGCQHVYHLHIHVAGGEPCLSRECYGSWKFELGCETPTKNQMERREEEFMQILNKELPDKIIEENKEAIAFYDPHSLATTHFLIAPKKRINMLQDIQEEHISLMGAMMLMAKNVANMHNLNGNPKYGGYRVVINNGKHGDQTIDYLHIQVLGGQQLNWPPY